MHSFVRLAEAQWGLAQTGLGVQKDLGRFPRLNVDTSYEGVAMAVTAFSLPLPSAVLWGPPQMGLEVQMGLAKFPILRGGTSGVEAEVMVMASP